MIHTLTAVVFAHVLADFLLQSRWMIATKRGAGFAVHGLVVLVMTLAALGHWARWEPYALVAAHLAIDAGKTWGVPARHRDGLATFLADQALHAATLFVTALVAANLWSSGAWASWPWLLPLMALGAGLVLTTRAGGFGIGKLMARFDGTALPRGLPQGGQMIGVLERLMIFLLVMVGQPGGIGFLIAAKSVLRFEVTTTGAGDDNSDHSAGEYVIIGTLASFAWALIVSYGCLRWLDALPPLWGTTGP
ncbi:MAG TPA: DUF3307 domain-containing protein [Rhodobacteraceae bacterium]|nr:DUF3307 domain-containing protein [Paracoccaceae bacterium]